MSITTQCPFHARTLPGDGTPLVPSPTLAAWRGQAPFMPLEFEDGHEGLIATRYDVAVEVLQDPRFSMRPVRMPVGPTGGEGPSHQELPGTLDPMGQLSEDLNFLTLDGDAHARLRRTVTARFSVRQARQREPWIRDTVAAQVDHIRAIGPVVDLWRDFAQPIAARTHCHILGIPDRHYTTFVDLFQETSSTQQKYDFIRQLLHERADHPGDDVISDLLHNDDLTAEEVQGLLRLLMGAGRDSVAYLIATTAVALLTDETQRAVLRDDPDAVRPAVEEFMRVGAMFLTLFVRTALEDVVIDGTTIPAGTSVAVSPVSANRDPARWERPEEFDVTRDAFGHLGFGSGIHGCVGQQIARVEIREAVRGLLEAFPNMTLVHAEQLEPLPFAHPVAVYEAGSVIVNLTGEMAQ